jgi:hypothetical protein
MTTAAAVVAAAAVAAAVLAPVVICSWEKEEEEVGETMMRCWVQCVWQHPQLTPMTDGVGVVGVVDVEVEVHRISTFGAAPATPVRWERPVQPLPQQHWEC